MIANSVSELLEAVRKAVEVKEDGVSIVDTEALRGEAIDTLAFTSALSEDEAAREAARWIIREVALASGVVPSSIQGLYEAMGRGEVSGFTVPAVNIRGITYGIARTLARSAMKCRCGAFIYEIAKSEIGYTFQRPAEYAASVLAALVKEGFEGPVFLQGDHFQVKAAKYREEPEKEIEGLKALTREAIEAGFFNIDIDASTLVDLSRPTEMEQQRDNQQVTAEMTRFIRSLEPEGVTVSVGGEIGEVGNKNSTVEDLVAFMDGYMEMLRGEVQGISKISVQTGTTHGGVVLPDGSVAKVKIDFETLEKLSEVARSRYGLAGAVQHGASTLPDEAFDHFPKRGTAEIHLATGFQNIVYDHEVFPAELREKVYDFLRKEFAGERKPDQTDEQFIYKTRKKGFGPFKKEFWTLPESVLQPIFADLEKKFDFLMEKLNVGGTAEHVARHVELVPVHTPMPASLAEKIRA